MVVDEVAVMTRMGVASRRGETASLARALAPLRPLHWLREPATLEGGDVVRIGRTLFAGLSRRTNRDGIVQLADILRPFGYSVVPVEVRGCLHLKSACCSLGQGAVLANRAWFDAAPFRDLRIIDVAEPWAADVLTIGQTVLMPNAFPRTRRGLGESGWRVEPIDVSELMKAEAGVTCMSILFDT